MKFIVNNLDEIDQVAQDFLDALEEHKIIAFYGKMGAGKTTFIKALCRKLGSNDNITSPTFALINEYKTAKNEAIYHFDFYRINKIEEIFDFGYEDYFYSGAFCFIEWPELIEEVLPENTIIVSIKEIDQNKREVVLQKSN